MDLDPARPEPGAAPEPASPTPAATPTVDDPASAAGTALRRTVRASIGVVLTACLALFVTKVLARFDVATLWDDAYIFQRYAHFVLHEGRVAWNPGGEPTYGLTSLLFLPVSVVARLAARGNSTLAALVASAVCGVAFVVLLLLLVLRQRPASAALRTVLFTLVVVCGALSSLSDHLVSGMDTTMVLAYLVVLVGLGERLERTGTRFSAVALGLVGGLSFAVRPETVLYALATPLAFGLRGRDKAQRREGWLALVLVAAVVALHLGACALYFKSPLPLPFWAKSSRLYGDLIWTAYRGQTTVELAAFLGAFWPLAALVVVDVGSGPRRALADASPLELGVAGAVAGCGAYYWLVALPVMAFSQRFFYPMLPGLVLLACRAAGRMERRFDGLFAELGRSALRLVALLGLAAAANAVAPALVTATRECAEAVGQQRTFRFGTMAWAKTVGPQKYWFKLDRFSEMPPDLVMATTEVGMLAALNLDKTVVDLAGLNERAFAHQAFSAEVFVTRFHPDLVYMPHPHYAQMIQALRKSPEFAAAYEEFSQKELGTTQFGLALRKDSRHYAAMRQLVGRERSPSGAARMTRPPAAPLPAPGPAPRAAPGEDAEE